MKMTWSDQRGCDKQAVVIDKHEQKQEALCKDHKSPSIVVDVSEDQALNRLWEDQFKKTINTIERELIRFQIMDWYVNSDIIKNQPKPKVIEGINNNRKIIIKSLEDLNGSVDKIDKCKLK